MKQDYFKSYKYFKIAQLVVLFAFAFTFFCILYFDENFRTEIFADKSLLTICVFLWAFMIYSAISIIWDFRQLEGNIIHDQFLSSVAYTDVLTGIPNRYGCDQVFEKYSHGQDISRVGCAFVCISNLSEINDMQGRNVGNMVLQDFSHIIDAVCSRYGFVGRNSGNEFLVVIEKCNREKMDNFFSELSASVEAYNSSEAHECEIAIYTADVLNEYEQKAQFTKLVARLYEVARRG